MQNFHFLGLGFTAGPLQKDRRGVIPLEQWPNQIAIRQLLPKIDVNGLMCSVMCAGIGGRLLDSLGMQGIMDAGCGSNSCKLCLEVVGNVSKTGSSRKIV